MTRARENFWGGLIKELREKQEMSQRHLAEEAKVNRSTLRSIESGETTGDILILERLLQVLGYELDAIKCDAPDTTFPLHSAA
jgi:transcriptional regulator with XRE-family HTH domain